MKVKTRYLIICIFILVVFISTATSRSCEHDDECDDRCRSISGRKAVYEGYCDWSGRCDIEFDEYCDTESDYGKNCFCKIFRSDEEDRGDRARCVDACEYHEPRCRNRCSPDGCWALMGDVEEGGYCVAQRDCTYECRYPNKDHCMWGCGRYYEGENRIYACCENPCDTGGACFEGEPVVCYRACGSYEGNPFHPKGGWCEATPDPGYEDDTSCSHPTTHCHFDLTELCFYHCDEEDECTRDCRESDYSDSCNNESRIREYGVVCDRLTGEAVKNQQICIYGCDNTTCIHNLIFCDRFNVDYSLSDTVCEGDYLSIKCDQDTASRDPNTSLCDMGCSNTRKECNPPFPDDHFNDTFRKTDIDSFQVDLSQYSTEGEYAEPPIDNVTAHNDAVAPEYMYVNKPFTGVNNTPTREDPLYFFWYRTLSIYPSIDNQYISAQKPPKIIWGLGYNWSKHLNSTNYLTPKALESIENKTREINQQINEHEQKYLDKKNRQIQHLQEIKDELDDLDDSNQIINCDLVNGETPSDCGEEDSYNDYVSRRETYRVKQEEFLDQLEIVCRNENPILNESWTFPEECYLTNWTLDFDHHELKKEMKIAVAKREWYMINDTNVDYEIVSPNKETIHIFGIPIIEVGGEIPTEIIEDPPQPVNVSDYWGEDLLDKSTIMETKLRATLKLYYREHQDRIKCWINHEKITKTVDYDGGSCSYSYIKPEFQWSIDSKDYVKTYNYRVGDRSYGSICNTKHFDMLLAPSQAQNSTISDIMGYVIWGKVAAHQIYKQYLAFDKQIAEKTARFQKFKIANAPIQAGNQSIQTIIAEDKTDYFTPPADESADETQREKIRDMLNTNSATVDFDWSVDMQRKFAQRTSALPEIALMLNVMTMNPEEYQKFLEWMWTSPPEQGLNDYFTIYKFKENIDQVKSPIDPNNPTTSPLSKHRYDFLWIDYFGNIYQRNITLTMKRATEIKINALVVPDGERYDIKLEFRLTDRNGLPVADRTLRWGVDTTEPNQVIETDSNGRATAEYELNANQVGIHTITTIFNGDEHYAASTKVKMIQAGSIYIEGLWDKLSVLLLFILVFLGWYLSRRWIRRGK